MDTITSTRILLKKESSLSNYQKIITWSAEDQAFIVEVPELPGCMADGRTQREAIANAEVIIDEWIETAKLRGWQIPKPGIKHS